MSPPQTQPNNRFAFISVTALFFMWGFITCMNDLLIPNFKVGLESLKTPYVGLGIVLFGYLYLIFFGFFAPKAKSSEGDRIKVGAGH